MRRIGPPPWLKKPPKSPPIHDGMTGTSVCGLLQHQLDAAAEREHVAAAREPSFGEDHHDLAGVEGPANGLERIGDGVRMVSCGCRCGACCAAPRRGRTARSDYVIVAAPEDERHWPRAREPQHEPVDVADVVGDDERAAGLGDAVAVMNAEAIAEMDDEPEEWPQRAAGIATSAPRRAGARPAKDRTTSSMASLVETECSGSWVTRSTNDAWRAVHRPGSPRPAERVVGRPLPLSS